VQDRDQEQAQKSSQPGEDAAEFMSEGAEDGVGGVARTTFEIAVVEMTPSAYMWPMTGSMAEPSSQLAPDGAKHPALDWR
jgi:hypothetical protein